jgi:hypothetical protein
MERVSLTHFVDFTLKIGAPRLTLVKDFKEHRYDHLTDFYKPLRESIVDMHEKKRPDASLDDLMGTLTDERKRRIFPGLVTGYRKFLHAQKPVWFTPPTSVLAMGDSEININPELGFEINGTPHLLKMYFRGEALARRRVQITLSLIMQALAASRPGTVFGMLDVKNARLHTLKAAPNPKLNLLMRGEMASFATIYNAA